MFRVILEAVDRDTARCRLVVLRRRSVKERQAIAVRYDHQIIADLDLRSGHVRIDLRIHHRHILYSPRVGRVCDLDDLYSVSEIASAVQVVPSILCLVELSLEEIMLVSIMESDYLQILDISLITGTLGIELI